MVPKKSFEGLSESMYYILLAFLGQERCGTDVSSYVEQVTHGRVRLGPGTLYTVLARFEEEGLIEETAVEGRKRTYRITEKGAELFHGELKRLRICVADGEQEVRG